ncbi:hypothetical protein ABN763_11110 [Spongiivirga sp. MCCC 1A20706]|uniref:hypothetical protein n=1 Tax=Spongiivirga sp. MCCC 1A20706 TaxID=3160963 RepID=UPI00397768E0
MRDFGINILRDESTTELEDGKLNLAPNPIYLTPVPDVEYVYLFQLIITNPQESNEHKTVDYKIGVKCLEIFEDDTALISFFKYDFFINKKQPSLIIDQIADEINDALYPITLLINRVGAVLSVTNLIEIKDRWKKKKSQLKLEYQGSLADKIFRQIDNRLDNEVNFELSLEKDLFLKTFLSKIFGSYNSNLKSYRGLLVPLSSGNSSFLIDGMYTLKRNITTYSTIFVEFEGSRLFTPKELNMFNNVLDTKIEVNSQVVFDLHEDTCLPKWIQLETSFTDTSSNDKIKQITLNINKLQGEQNSKRLEIASKKEEELEREKEVQTRKKRFSIFKKK